MMNRGSDVAQSWAILLGARRRDTAGMLRPVLKPAPTISEALEALLGFPGRSPAAVGCSRRVGVADGEAHSVPTQGLKWRREGDSNPR